MGPVPRISIQRLAYRSGQRGFSLIEMLAVVMMITIFAAGAIPLVTKQMRERRTREAAERIASLYRGARLRAMGRGVAVLVRFGATGYQVLEAQRGLAIAGNQLLPVPSCTTPNWNGTAGTDFRIVTTFNPATLGQYEGVSVSMAQGATARTSLDICFTPMGRSYFRTVLNQPLTTLTLPHSATVARTGGRTQRVAVLPTGAARVL